MPDSRPVRHSKRLLGFALVVVLAGCSAGDEPRAAPPTTTSTTAPSTSESVTVVAVGDLVCAPGRRRTEAECHHEETARLAEEADPDAVLLLGDLQYETGTLDAFRRAYEPTWGRLKDRSKPSPGNHEFAGGRASGYFSYFGAAAGEVGKGWYSFDLGGWHVVSLNSNCGVVGCGPGSEQHRWLDDDLARNDARCTLAFWHHPWRSSGLHGATPAVEPLVEVLQRHDVELVLGGHDHHYERFAPVDGLRQFVVGTGGRSLYPVIGAERGSEVRQSASFGILVLELGDDGYRWRFVADPTGRPFTDSGEGSCRGTGAARPR
jgi:acid phosphatase type 7